MGPNELLYWLSARRAGSWSQFRTAVEEILQSEADSRSGSGRIPLYQQIRFNLQQLGHVEFDAVGCEGGWRVVPPVLALSQKRDCLQGILCGARLPELVRALQDGANSCRFEQHEEPGHPDVIRFISEDVGHLEAVARCAGAVIQPHASISILSCLPRVTDLGGWHAGEAQLPFGQDWEIRRFEVTRRSCRWVEASAEEANKARDGLFRLTRFQTPEHYLRLGGRTFRVGGQVGKFFLLAQRRQLLRYNPATCQLVVPDIFRPPLLVDRALVLCSGFLPRYDKVLSTLSYTEIPEGIAGMAANILCQERI